MSEEFDRFKKAVKVIVNTPKEKKRKPKVKPKKKPKKKGGNQACASCIPLPSYKCLGNIEATWFIDPPYQNGGDGYYINNKHINYDDLSKWCMSRDGQVIVCESTRANWLPFYPMKKLQPSSGKSNYVEAIWSNYPHNFQARQPSLFEVKDE